jgi:Leucine Rich Repeat
MYAPSHQPFCHSTKTLSPFHQLFDFTNLRGFSLTLTPGFYNSQVDMFLDGTYHHVGCYSLGSNQPSDEQSASRNFWDMLIRRCPNLEELTIDGISSLPTDVHTLVDGRWPKLRKLTLGDVSIDGQLGMVNNSDQKHPFITFLEAHPTLQSLSLSRHNIQPTHFASLDPVFLKLTEFRGTLQQLQALPHLLPLLKSVTFRDPMQTRDISALTVAGVLQSLPSLTELKISFILHSMYDSGNLLRSLISSCPRIRHLDLTCAHKPSFQLVRFFLLVFSSHSTVISCWQDSFSKNIRGFTKLRTLHLTIVKYPGDETLSAGAARIARTNPRLEKFTLTFLPPSHPLPLPYSIPLFPFPLPSRATGIFKLTCDEHGLPVSLAGLEHRRVIWPFGLGVTSRRKKYVSDLRPRGYPGRRKRGLDSVTSLLLERSVAGEEMRMILFCGLLVCLAMWGFMAGGRSSVRGQLRGAVEL